MGDVKRNRGGKKINKSRNKRRENVSCTRGEHALTPHSGRSGVDGSGSSGSSSSRKGYMCRARNIGYIVLLLAGVGGLPPQSPLKGSSTLERTHYIHLQRIRQRDREKWKRGGGNKIKRSPKGKYKQQNQRRNNEERKIIEKQSRGRRHQ